MNLSRLILPAFLLAISACSDPDPCENKDCGAQGYCEDGNCFCNPGWKHDSSGKCTVQDHCAGAQCVGYVHCDSTTGECICDPGWIKDFSGFCLTPDPCYQIDCGAHGTCNQSTGACDCALGYMLDSNGKCNQEVRALFLGSWTGSHTNDFGQTSPVYTMTVEAVSGDITKVLVKNFMNYTCGSLSQPMQVYATYTTLGVDFTSLCADYQTDGAFDAASLLSADVLQVDVFITSGGSGYNLTGIYNRD